jgi:hypothetical protein
MIRWVDGIFVTLLIIEDSVDLVNSINVERIEIGSIGVFLKEVPKEWWSHIISALSRIVNVKGFELDNQQKATDVILGASEAFARLNQQLKDGIINEEEHTVLRNRVAEIHNLPLQAFSVRVDGMVIVGDRAGPPALDTPRQRLALTSGDSPEGPTPPASE